MRSFVLVLSVLSVTKGIRVPVEWPKVENLNLLYLAPLSTGNDYSSLPNYPPLSPNLSRRKTVFPYPKKGTYTFRAQPQFKPQYKKRNQANREQNFKQSLVYGDFPLNSNGWRPLIKQNLQQTVSEKEHQTKFVTSHPNKAKSFYKFHSNFKPDQPILYKNYRDDKTHEPITYSDEDTYESDASGEETKDFQRKEAELERDIPTRPIYPGEGKWTQPGKKHPSLIKTQRYSNLESLEDTEPVGHDVFDLQNEKFQQYSDLIPQKQDLSAYIEENEEKGSQEEESQVEDEEAQEEGEGESSEGFIPTQLYSQVRRSETEDHEPILDENINAPRLREIIKDSKVHTVYTEEGYEDLGYDHAGHEKHAENKEGHRNFEHDETALEGGQVLESPEQTDADAAGTEYVYTNKPKKNVKSNTFTKTKGTKRTALKETGNGNMTLEISNEVKIMDSPNNTSTTHMFIKIVPLNKSNSKKGAINIEEHKRSKRYDKQMLSKKYVRKRPNYYWKRKGISPSIHFHKSQKVIKREKRYTNDFPDISSDSAFIDKIKLEIPPQAPDLTHVKYPYYKLRTNVLHKNSPLRYAEDLNNIPSKRQGNLAFYEQANKFICPEIQGNVNAVPDRIRNMDFESETDDIAESPKVSRLQHLGGKIECLKARFFGSDPLDSPFFKESKVEPPEPIFKIYNDNKISAKVISGTEEVYVSQPVVFYENGNENTLKVVKENNSNIFVVDAKKESERNPKILSLPNPKLQIDDVITDVNNLEGTSSDSPETLPLRLRRRRKKHPYRIIGGPNFQSTSYPIYNYVTARTVLPTYKTVSEVHYKNEIKPNEQLNVFADVINNIRNSTIQNMQSVASGHSIKVMPSPNIANIASRKVPSLQVAGESKLYVTRIPFTPNVPNNHNIDEYIRNIENEEIRDPTSFESQKVHKVRKTTTTVAITSTESTAAKHEDEIVIVGLSPPQNWKFKGFKHPVRVTVPNKINTFYVRGMKPPGKEKPFMYNDYVLPENIRTRKYNQQYGIRRKRSAPKPTYSEIRRTYSATTEKNEQDGEYMPHRSRNYHYDVGNDKIVYHTTEPEETAAPSEEVVHVEATSRAPEKSPKTDRFPVGRTFLDFISKLKSAINYQNIPDPTPTKNAQAMTERPPSTSTIKITTPEFLKFVANLKSDPGYQPIYDKKHNNVERSAEDSKESQTNMQSAENAVSNKDEIGSSNIESDVKTSPGEYSNDQTNHYDQVQIFDISSYLPKPKNYVPATSVDTSKYQSIQRKPTFSRHSISSKYNSQEVDKILESIGTTEATDATDMYEQYARTEAEYQQYSSTEAERLLPQQLHINTHIATGKSPHQQDISVETEISEKREPEQQAASIEAKLTTSKESENYEPQQLDRSTEVTESYKQAISEETESHPKYAAKDYEAEESPSASEEIFSSTEPTPALITTTTEVIRQRIRGRKIPVTSEEPLKTQKTRRRTRIKSTTDTSYEEALETSSVGKKVKRTYDNDNANQYIPPNHKPVYVPLVDDELDLISGEILKLPENNNTETLQIEVPTVVQNADLTDVEIFAKYNESQAHGGNYKNEEDVSEEIVKSSAELISKQDLSADSREDFESFPEGLFSALLTLANFGSEENQETAIPLAEEETASAEEEDNFRRKSTANMDIESTEGMSNSTAKDKELTRNTNNVEVLTKDDETKKHGGNYKSVPEIEHIVSSETYDLPSNSPVTEEESIESNSTAAEASPAIKSKKLPPNSSVESFSKYDKLKKHGGNYRKEVEGEVAPANTNYAALPEMIEQTETSREVVPRSFSYYSDNTLPARINQLKESRIVPAVDLEEEHTKVEEKQNYHMPQIYVYLDKTRYEGTTLSATPLRTSRKNIPDNIRKDVKTITAKIIKDPSKRLYYYAPLRK